MPKNPLYVSYGLDGAGVVTSRVVARVPCKYATGKGLSFLKAAAPAEDLMAVPHAFDAVQKEFYQVKTETDAEGNASLVYDQAGKPVYKPFTKKIPVEV